MNDHASRSWFDVLLSGLSTQAAVIRALSLRELQQRFGRENIGYLWVIAEPMMLASVVTMLHAAVAGGSDAGMSPFTFMLTGYSIYIIFRNTFNLAESALHSSETLMYHGMITPFDIMLSKSLVETIGCLSALVFLQIGGILIGVADWPARPIYLVAAILLFAWWSFALTMIVASYSYRSPFMGRLVHPMSYFALPLSGAFTSMSILPVWTRPFMAWNPMMSVFEMARYGQFENASHAFFYPSFVVAVAVATTYWGLLEIRRVRKHIHVP